MGVWVGLAVAVRVGVRVGVDVDVGVGVNVDVLVGVGLGVLVGVKVGEGVWVAVAVGDAVGRGVAVGSGVSVALAASKGESHAARNIDSEAATIPRIRRERTAFIYLGNICFRLMAFSSAGSIIGFRLVTDRDNFPFHGFFTPLLTARHVSDSHFIGDFTALVRQADR